VESNDSRTARQPVPRRLRFEILRRDNHTCRYCGQSAPDVKLTVDHVVPVVLGGSNDPTNLVAACKDCNAGKASVSPSSTLVADVADDAAKWSRAMQAAASARERASAPRTEYVDAFETRWSTYRNAYDHAASLDSSWRGSLGKFHDLGLPRDMMLTAVDRALGNDRVAFGQEFRYFCGVAWRMLDELAEDARAILRADEAGA
jgi:hypothetical protein